MSSPVKLASFCRLCLSKTKDKVPVFANGNMLDNLLHLIEILIDPDDEPDAVVCYDCVVTLEGFHQFKEQCHVNDEFVKTVPAKLDCSASSAEMDGVEEEEDEDENNREEGLLDEDLLEEEDHLELSEAEEVFQKPRQSPKSNKKKKTPVKSPKKKKKNKKSLKGRPAKQQQRTAQKTSGLTSARLMKKRHKEMKSNHSTIDELQVLAESYPDFFYFEKGARSIYYTIVFYGERYNSALFTERCTYWQCIHRRKFQCPAQVKVTNDYKTFERRYEHTHAEMPEKEGQAFTPHEALPEVFQICKRIVQQKREKNVNQNASFEDKFQQFAAETSLETENDKEESVSPKSGQKSPLTEDNSDEEEEPEVVSSGRPKRKIKPNVRYGTVESKPKKRALEPEVKPKKESVVKSVPKSLGPVDKSKTKQSESKQSEIDDDQLEDIEGEEVELAKLEEEDLDLAKIEQECEALNVPRKPLRGPALDDQLVLADSYPDYFFFEKGPRSIYFTLVYYGERYNSATYTENYTYWQCQHRRKYKCPAQVVTTNSYIEFERRYEHTHGDLPDKEGQAFTPLEALPQVFEICRSIVLKNRAKRRGKLLEKYKFLHSANSSSSEQETSTTKVDERSFVEVPDTGEEVYVDTLEEELILKDAEYYEELIEEVED